MEFDEADRMTGSTDNSSSSTAPRHPIYILLPEPARAVIGRSIPGRAAMACWKRGPAQRPGRYLRRRSTVTCDRDNIRTVRDAPPDGGRGGGSNGAARPDLDRQRRGFRSVRKRAR
jgi:arginine/ornithine N-succinyltransferase beta subunit